MAISANQLITAPWPPKIVVISSFPLPWSDQLDLNNLLLSSWSNHDKGCEKKTWFWIFVSLISQLLYIESLKFLWILCGVGTRILKIRCTEAEIWAKPKFLFAHHLWSTWTYQLYLINLISSTWFNQIDLINLTWSHWSNQLNLINFVWYIDLITLITSNLLR